MREPIHMREESRMIQSMAWWTLGTGILGITHGKILGGTSVIIGAGMAANYWAHPTYDWRRTMDIVWVQLVLWSHLYYAWWSSACMAYYSISAVGGVFYGLSWMLYRMGRTYDAIIAHMLLTVCANLSLTVLYAAPNLPPA